MALFSRKNKTISKDVSQEVKKEKKVIADKKAPSMKELYSEEGVKTTVAKTEKGEKPTRIYANAYSVLIKPLITEKAANFGPEGKYVFAVAARANKIEIARAVKEVYGIKPVAVNVINIKGKNIKYGRTSGFRKSWRKAIVKLPPGKSINIYEGV